MEHQETETLKQQYYTLSAKVDRLDQAERKHDFIICDSSVKIGIAEGLAKGTHHDISQLRLEIVELRSEMKELRASTDAHFEVLEEKVDRCFETLMQRIGTHESWVAQKFNAHDAILEEHTSLLNQHTSILEQHTNTLNQHTSILEQHTRLLNQILEKLQ